jgi:hypothetical protein
MYVATWYRTRAESPERSLLGAPTSNGRWISYRSDLLGDDTSRTEETSAPSQPDGDGSGGYARTARATWSLSALATDLVRSRVSAQPSVDATSRHAPADNRRKVAPGGVRIDGPAVSWRTRACTLPDDHCDTD